MFKVSGFEDVYKPRFIGERSFRYKTESDSSLLIQISQHESKSARFSFGIMHLHVKEEIKTVAKVFRIHHEYVQVSFNINLALLTMLHSVEYLSSCWSGFCSARGGLCPSRTRCRRSRSGSQGRSLSKPISGPVGRSLRRSWSGSSSRSSSRSSGGSLRRLWWSLSR